MAAMAPSMTLVSAVAAMSTVAGIQSGGQSTKVSLESPMVAQSRALGGKLAVKSQGQLGRRIQCSRVCVIAAEETGSAADAGGDSVVSEVAVLEDEPATPGIAVSGEVAKGRKPGALQRGGTLEGNQALGKDPSLSTLGKTSSVMTGDRFEDPRWVSGNWDLTKFTVDGKVSWDSVIDAEVRRRKWLEENPEASRNDEPVLFETSTVPWWAWVKRFHLPEAELLNGRAAMIGYVAGYLVDSATGVGLVDQQSSFFGKLLLFITIVGVLLIRKNEDLSTLKELAKESTFYDKQWQASWKEDTTKDNKPQI